MAHVFLSYSHADRDYVHLLAEDLRQHGFDVWFDERIGTGERWPKAIVQAITECGAFVVVMTPEAENSEWVEKEVLLAQRERKAIFPLLRRGKEFALLITVQYADVKQGQMPPADFYTHLGRTVTPGRKPGSFVASSQSAPTPASAVRSVPTLVVNRLGRGDCRTISEAIRKAQPGTQIRVQPGVYAEGIVIDKPLEIVGDGPVEQVVVECSDAECIFIKTDAAVVRGLTLRGCAGRKDKRFYCIGIPQGQPVLEDCDITSDSLACVGIQGDTATPTLRRCRIHDSKTSGVVVYSNGAGILEKCDIYGNARAGVEIKTGGSPTLHDCQIRKNQGGVLVCENGTGTLEGCTILGNTLVGVEIKTGGNPTIRNCHINRNTYEAVYVHDKGRGTVEACDLTGNGGKGAWDIEAGCDVKRSGNREK